MARGAITPVLCSLLFGLVFPSIVSAQKEPSVAALITQLKDKDETVRLKAAKALGKLKEKAKDALPALTAALKDDDEDVRTVAKKSIDAIRGALGNAEKPDDEIGALVKDLRSKDVKVRIAALKQLGELGSKAKDAGAAIVEFGMLSNNKAVRDAAVVAFEQIDPTVYKETLTLLVDRNTQERSAAIAKLKKMGSEAKAAIPALKKVFKEFPDPESEFIVLDAMLSIVPDDAEFQTMLLNSIGAADHALSDERRRGKGGPTIRHLAIAKSKAIKVDPAKKCGALMTGLGLTVRDHVLIIKELGAMGPDAKKAVPMLKKLKTHPDKLIREAAQAAIDKISE